MVQRDKKERSSLPAYLHLPMMTLREVVVFPRSIMPLVVGRQVSIKAVERALSDYDKHIFLLAQRNPEIEKPGLEDLYSMGTVCKILQLLRLPDGTVKVLFEGLQRAHWDESNFSFSGSNFPVAGTYPIEEEDSQSKTGEALMRAVQESLEKYTKINKKLAQETILAISSIDKPGKMADAIIPHLKVEYSKKQNVLEAMDPFARLEEVYGLLEGEIEISSVERRIKDRVKKASKTPTFMGLVFINILLFLMALTMESLFFLESTSVYVDPNCDNR